MLQFYIQAVSVDFSNFPSLNCECILHTGWKRHPVGGTSYMANTYDLTCLFSLQVDAPEDLAVEYVWQPTTDMLALVTGRCTWRSYSRMWSAIRI